VAFPAFCQSNFQLGKPSATMRFPRPFGQKYRPAARRGRWPCRLCWHWRFSLDPRRPVPRDASGRVIGGGVPQSASNTYSPTNAICGSPFGAARPNFAHDPTGCRSPVFEHWVRLSSANALPRRAANASASPGIASPTRRRISGASFWNAGEHHKPRDSDSRLSAPPPQASAVIGDAE